jgi:translation initiation factor IF-1
MSNAACDIEATVLAELPNRLYRVETAEGRHLTVGPSPEAKRLGMDIRRGERVLVRPSQNDPLRGLIVGPVRP